MTKKFDISQANDKSMEKDFSAMLVILIVVGVLLFVLTSQIVTFHISCLIRYPDRYRLKVTMEIMKIPVWKRTFDLEENMDMFHVSGNWKTNWRLIRPVVNRMDIRDVRWETGIGLGDAAVTGMATGMVWTLKEMGMAFLNSVTTFQNKPEIIVQPNYVGEGFYSTFTCHVTVKPPVLLKLIKVRRNWRKGRKGGW